MSKATTAAPTVPIAALVESPSNPRQSWDEVALAELTESVKAQGIIEPIIVRPLKGKKDKYEIVCGSRRYRAAKAAGLKVVPALTRSLNDREVLEIQVVENQQRQDVHPMEEAQGYARLRDDHKVAVPEIAKQIGMSVAHVYARLKLAALGGKCKKAFLANTITAGHAILLARLAPDMQSVVEERGLWHERGVVPRSVRDLQGFIDSQLRRKLSKAAWKLDEEVADLPVCGTCPYNSSNDPGNPEDGTCLDRRCYEDKLDAVIAKAREEAEAAGEPLVPVTDARYTHLDGVVPAIDYKVVRAQDAKKMKGVERAIHVAGDSKGKQQFIKRVTAASKPAREKSLRELQEEEAERERKACNKGRKLAFAEVVTNLWNETVDGTAKAELLTKLIDFCATAAFTKTFTQNLYDSTARRHDLLPADEKLEMGAGCSLVGKHLRSLNVQQKLAFLAEAYAQHSVALSKYEGGQADRLTELAKIAGVNVKQYEKEAMAEAKERADARAARAEAKRQQELAEVKRIRAEEAKARAKQEEGAKAVKKAKASLDKAKGKSKSKPKKAKAPKPKPTKAAKPKAKAAAKSTKPKTKSKSKKK